MQGNIDFSDLMTRAIETSMLCPQKIFAFSQQIILSLAVNSDFQPVVNFTSILRAAFVPISLHQKSTKSNCN